MLPPWPRELEIQLGLFGYPITALYTVHNWLAFTGFIVVSFHYGEAVKFHTGFLRFMLMLLMYIC